VSYFYSPTNSDATNVATDAATRINAITGTPTLSPPIVDPNFQAFLKAQADSMLLSVGYQDRNAAATVGSFTTTSGSFVDIGNGSSTGFSTYTFAAPIAKTYLVSVDLSCYLSGLGGGNGFQLQLVNATTSASYSDAATKFEVNSAGQVQHYAFRFGVPMNAGSNVLKLQALALTGCTFAVDSLCFRCFTVTG
jgi:hypothetical protein